MRFDRFNPDELEKLTPWEEVGFPLSDDDVKHCARKSLDSARSLLPRLNKQQIDTLIGMMVEAFDQGWKQRAWEQGIGEYEGQERLRQLAVAARRRKSKREDIAKAFADSCGEVTIESLMKRFNVSRPTVYRALQSKPTTTGKVSRRRS